MGSANVQGDLWGRAPLDWTNIQELLYIPLWKAMLNVSGVSKDTQFDTTLYSRKKQNIFII